MASRLQTGEMGPGAPPGPASRRRRVVPLPDRGGKDIPVDELIGHVATSTPSSWPGGHGRPRPGYTGARPARVYQAVQYLVHANQVLEGEVAPSQALTAAGKDVVVIGVGTRADCLGTALRQGALSVHQLEIMPQPLPAMTRPPWLAWPRPLRSSAAHHEGGDRAWSVSTRRFLDDGHGRLAGLELADVTMRRTMGDRASSWSRLRKGDGGRTCPAGARVLGPERSPCWSSSGRP